MPIRVWIDRLTTVATSQERERCTRKENRFRSPVFLNGEPIALPFKSLVSVRIRFPSLGYDYAPDASDHYDDNCDPEQRLGGYAILPHADLPGKTALKTFIKSL